MIVARACGDRPRIGQQNPSEMWFAAYGGEPLIRLIMNRTILVVDDDPEIRQMLRINLSQENFDVVLATNGREALFVARDSKPDLIILDLMMPKMDGYEFMRVFGRESDTPIICLTARVEETDQVLGLEMGADDYVTKPFSMRALTARIRAVLRRTEKASADDGSGEIKVGPLTLDRNFRLVTVNGSPADLTPSEFEILAILMSNPGAVFSRLDLIEGMQGTFIEGYERSIDVHVRNLRRKIEPDPSKPQFVETVYGMGYRLGLRRD